MSRRLTGGRGGGQVRRRKKNRGRARYLRQFVVDTYGLEVLRRGTGVLDVAGGKGELGLEFINLEDVPATVIEPR
jgi:ubiquinone/menaquinone biosynthesis C-methylase UbiE